MANRDGEAAGIDLDAVREEAEAAVAEALPDEEAVAADVDIQEADVEHAASVVLEKGLETTDFVRFRSFLLQDDYEPDEIEELWAILRNEDRIPRGTRKSDDSEPAAGGNDQPAHDHEGEDAPAQQLAAFEGDVEGAEAVYLLKTANCPTCIQAERALEGWIEDGVVTTLNFPDNPRAENIVDALGIREVPTLVAEVEDGQFRQL